MIDRPKVATSHSQHCSSKVAHPLGWFLSPLPALLFVHDCADDSNTTPTLSRKSGDGTTSLGLIKDNNETEETTEMILDCTRQRGTHHTSTSFHRYFICYLFLFSNSPSTELTGPSCSHFIVMSALCYCICQIKLEQMSLLVEIVLVQCTRKYNHSLKHTHARSHTQAQSFLLFKFYTNVLMN